MCVRHHVCIIVCVYHHVWVCVREKFVCRSIGVDARLEKHDLWVRLICIEFEMRQKVEKITRFNEL